MRSLIRLVSCLLLSMPLLASPLFNYPMDPLRAVSGVPDLSSWNLGRERADARIRVQDGHLFRDGQRIRLLGVNLAFGAAMPSHEDADHMAARLASFGINAVRLHHLDSRPAPEGLLSADKLHLDEDALERFDYLLAALEKHGIYIDLNLHVGRSYPGFTPWPGVDGRTRPQYWKGVDLFFPPMQAMQRDYARMLLRHRNPYTGRIYAEDSGIALVEINNEDGLLHEWLAGTLDAISEPFAAELRSQWQHWLLARYPTDAALTHAWGARNGKSGQEMLTAGRWVLQTVGGARASLQQGSVLQLDMQQAGAEDWHVQLHQNNLVLHAGQPYTLHLRIRADHPLQLAAIAMQAHAPWKSLWRSRLAVGEAWQDFDLVFTPSDEENLARLTLGELGHEHGRLWIAAASLQAGGAVALAAGENRSNVGLPLARRQLALSGAQMRDWATFLWDRETAYWQGMRDYLRHDLGVKALLIGTQVSYSPAPIQAMLDVVDGHAYWQHPRFPGRPWDPANWSIGNSAMAGVDGGGTLADLALRRVAGKPFVVTEYNHPAPAEHAAEGLPLLAAYAALQDWDALFVFDYQSTALSHAGIPGFFDIAGDPAKMSALPACAALFRRGDIGSPGLAPAALPPRSAMLDTLLRQRVMPSAEWLGVARNAVLQGPVSLSSPPGAAISLPVASVNHQLWWGAGGAPVVLLDAPNSKGLIGAPGKQEIRLGGLGLQLLDAASGHAVLLATALEGKGFATPGHVLLTALGMEGNTGMRWLDDKHDSVGRQWGNAPVLAEAIKARISLPVAASRVRAWALDANGQRLAALTVSGREQASITLPGPVPALWVEVEIH